MSTRGQATNGKSWVWRPRCRSPVAGRLVPAAPEQACCGCLARGSSCWECQGGGEQGLSLGRRGLKPGSIPYHCVNSRSHITSRSRLGCKLGHVSCLTGRGEE